METIDAMTLRVSTVNAMIEAGSTTWLGFLVFMSQHGRGITTPPIRRIDVERDLRVAGFMVANAGPKEGGAAH